MKGGGEARRDRGVRGEMVAGGGGGGWLSWGGGR